MRIGFFGGSFDPPHRGHRAIATAAADGLRLDRVLVAPVGKQPLKAGMATAAYEDRMAMTRLGFAGEARFEVSDVDRPKPSGDNYTYETLTRLIPRLKADVGDFRLFCLLGADSFHTLKHWHRAADLLLLCDFIVAARPGYSLDALGDYLPRGLRIADETRHGERSEVRIAASDGTARHTTLHVLTSVSVDVSATGLRQALNENDWVAADEMLAPEVGAYIREHGLYSKQMISSI